MILDNPKGRIKHFLAFVSDAIYSDAKQTRALIRALPFPPDLTHAYLHNMRDTDVTVRKYIVAFLHAYAFHPEACNLAGPKRQIYNHFTLFISGTIAGTYNGTVSWNTYSSNNPCSDTHFSFPSQVRQCLWEWCIDILNILLYLYRYYINKIK